MTTVVGALALRPKSTMTTVVGTLALHPRGMMIIIIDALAFCPGGAMMINTLTFRPKSTMMITSNILAFQLTIMTDVGAQNIVVMDILPFLDIPALVLMLPLLALDLQTLPLVFIPRDNFPPLPLAMDFPAHLWAP